MKNLCCFLFLFVSWLLHRPLIESTSFLFIFSTNFRAHGKNSNGTQTHIHPALYFFIYYLEIIKRRSNAFEWSAGQICTCIFANFQMEFYQNGKYNKENIFKCMLNYSTYSIWWYTKCVVFLSFGFAVIFFGEVMATVKTNPADGDEDDNSGIWRFIHSIWHVYISSSPI